MTDKKISCNNEFYIDEINLKRITKRPIKKYSICDIPLREIRMKIEDAFYSLEETPAYLYLIDPIANKQQYMDYCTKYGQENPNRTIENYDKLIRSFSIENYDLKKGAIAVNQDNIIMEGQHRCCILLHQLGRDYKVKVIKLYYQRTLRGFFRKWLIG